MATYQLINLRIETPQGGNRIAGQENREYLAAAAVNPFDKTEPTHKVTFFDEETVRYYKNLLPKSRGGNLEVDEDSWTEGEIEPIDRVMMNAFDSEYDLGGDYCQTYSADIIDADGNVVHKEGDIIVNGDGSPKVIRTIMVFVQQKMKTVPVVDQYGIPQFDKKGRPLSKPLYDKETGDIIIEGWVKGRSPHDVGEGRRRLLISLEAAKRRMMNAVTEEPPAREESNDDDANA